MVLVMEFRMKLKVLVSKVKQNG